MTKHIWALQKIGFGVESTAGTGVAVSDPVPKRAGMFQAVTTTTPEDASFGNINETERHHVDYEHGELNGLVVPVGHKTIWYQLLAAFWQQSEGIEFTISSVSGTFQVGETITGGTSSETATVVRTDSSWILVAKSPSGTFTDGETITGWTSSATATANYDSALRSHVFEVPNTNNHKTLSIRGIDPNETIRGTYWMIEELTIDYDSEWELTATSSWKTKKPASQSEPALTFGSETLFRGKDLKIYFADTEAWLEGATATKIETLSISFVKNLYPDVLNGDIDAIYNQRMAVGGNFSWLFDATTLKGYVQAWTTKYMKIEVIATGATIWSASNPKLVIVAGKVGFTSHNKSDGNNEVVRETLDFTCHLNNTDGYTVKSELLNDKTTDY